MRALGVVQSGLYQGQRYVIVGRGTSPDWYLCNVSDGNGLVAQREIHKKHLEHE